MSDGAHFPTILVPTDFSPTARRALDFARDLARATGPSRIVLVHAHFVPLEIEALAVRGVERVFSEIEEQARRDLGELAAELEKDGLEVKIVALEGAPESVILKAVADEAADLVVMGTHARKGLGHLFLGSVAERVLRLAPCAVATVPPAA